MITVTYWGHSCFEIAAGDHAVLIDPFLRDNPLVGRIPARYLSVGAEARVQLTAILVTHAHSDHLGDAVELSKDSGAPIIAVNELALWCGTKGAKVAAANIGGSVDIGGADSGVSAKLVPAVHSSSLRDGDFKGIGSPAGFLLSIGGMRIYHAGDTALFSDMGLVAGADTLDLALLPIGDRFTMGVADAVAATKILRPTTVIPMHYATFEQLEPDALGFQAQVSSADIGECVVMQVGQGQEFERSTS